MVIFMVKDDSHSLLPTTGPLHMLFSLPVNAPVYYPSVLSVITKCYFLRKAFVGYYICFVGTAITKYHN